MHLLTQSARRILIACLLVASVACASGGNTVYVAASLETVQLQQETGIGGRNKPRIAYVVNHSSVPIIVTDVTVQNCKNIRQFCGRNAMQVKVQPNRRHEVLRVEAIEPNDPMSYAFSYRWHTDSAAQKLNSAIAEGIDVPAQPDMSQARLQIASARADTARHDRELSSAGVRALGDRMVLLRADPDTIVLHVGDVMFSLQFRVLAVGKDGVVLGRVREGLLRQFPDNDAVKFFPPDTLRAVAPGVASANIRLSPGVDTAHAPPPGVHFTIIVQK